MNRGAFKRSTLIYIFLLITFVEVYAKKGIANASFSTIGTHCQNATVDFIDNSSTTSGTIIAWIWDFDDGSSSTDREPSHIFTSSGDYEVTLTVIDSEGDSHTFTSTITVEPAPTLDFTITSGDACQLTEQTFISTASITSGSVDSYSWNFGDGNIDTNPDESNEYDAPGIYDVSLTATSDLGCTSTTVKEIEIFEEPSASFIFNDVCFGDEVNFTNTSSITSGNLTYSWDFDEPGETSTLKNPSHEYGSADDYTVTLTVTSSDGGCETTVQETVSVYENPVANFSADPVCFGNATLFENNSTGTSLTYNWDFGDGNTSTAFEPSHTYDAPGSYIVELLVTSLDNCTNSIELRVDVYENPQPTFFVANACLDDGVLFSNLTNESDGALTYEWDFDDTNTSTDKNPEHFYSDAGDYTVVLTATTTSNCVGTYSSTITVWPQPEADFSFVAGCDGVINTFTNNSSISSGSIASYEWNYGDGSVSYEETGSHSYDTPGDYDVTLTAISENGCEDVATETITIYAKPVTDFEVSSSCSSNEITFSNTSTVSEGNLTYNWDFGDGTGTSAAVNPQYEYTATGTYNVTLEATNNVGGCGMIIEKEIDVFDIPTASFSTNPVCFGEATLFVNNSAGSNPTYIWNFGDGTTSTSFSPTHQYESPGTYVATLQITSEDGCIRSTEQEIDIYNNPVPTFFASNSCLDDVVLFTNLSDESSGPLNYEWDFGDGETSTQKNPEHFYAAPGTYTVSLTVASGSNCVTPTSSDITIYPLPDPDFTVDAVCDAEISLFTNQSTISDGTISTYEWDFGDLSGSSLENPEKQYLNAATYDVTLTATSNYGCEASITKQAVVEEVPVANFEVGNVCFGNPIITTNNSDGNGGALTYEWDFGDGNNSVSTAPSHVYTSAGIYPVLLTATSSAGCQDTFEQSVIIYATPQIEAGNDTLLSRGSSVQLNAQGGNTYSWSPIAGLDNSNVSNPIARPLEDTDYVVLVTDAFGCQNRDTIRITLEEDFIIVPTNIITPDENGQNDTWVIQNADAFDQVWVRVYDRYGVLVFEDDDYQNTWRGARGTDILPDGTYYYLITFPGQEIKYSGSLTIIRNN